MDLMKDIIKNILEEILLEYTQIIPDVIHNDCNSMWTGEDDDTIRYKLNKMINGVLSKKNVLMGNEENIAKNISCLYTQEDAEEIQRMYLKGLKCRENEAIQSEFNQLKKEFNEINSEYGLDFNADEEGVDKKVLSDKELVKLDELKLFLIEVNRRIKQDENKDIAIGRYKLEIRRFLQDKIDKREISEKEAIRVFDWIPHIDMRVGIILNVDNPKLYNDCKHVWDYNSLTDYEIYMLKVTKLMGTNSLEDYTDLFDDIYRQFLKMEKEYRGSWWDITILKIIKSNIINCFMSYRANMSIMAYHIIILNIPELFPVIDNAVKGLKVNWGEI